MCINPFPTLLSNWTIGSVATPCHALAATLCVSRLCVLVMYHKGSVRTDRRSRLDATLAGCALKHAILRRL